ncbi:DNA replication endonuclease-helicase Dna2 [Friedmanniomyces endolithicus]|nr:DNA replication endonuclease-helicase Dna2 [Friedmanniomyces endolithicus]
MASRTKGFFEEGHKGKPRPGQWHRGHSNKQPLTERDPNAASAKPAIPATSQSKTKLKAFQFAPNHNEQLDDGPREQARASEEQERSEAPVGGSTSNIQANSSSAPEKSAGPATSSQAEAGMATLLPQLPHANTFPCTPGARLALEDLIGNFDENVRKKQPQPEHSPEEQLGWIPNSSNTLLTPHRKRKRAKSSSPSCSATSSQRQEASMFFAANGTQGERKTPDPDPTKALWQTYGAGNDSEGTVKLPQFRHLAAQASPRPNETPIKSAGFRRWASTGNDWPTSKNKRRRMDSRTSVSLWRDEQQTGANNKSRVAEMVEKIQETLATQKLAQSAAKQPAEAEAPTSSSPVAEPTEASHAADVSPLQVKWQPAVWPKPPGTTRMPQAAVALSTAHNLPSGDSMLERNAATVVDTAFDVVKPTSLHLQSKAPLPAFKRPSISRTISTSGRQYPTKQPSPPLPIAPAPLLNDMDEFGDDFDLTAEDLDELVSQVPLDQRPLHAIPPHPDPPAAQAMFLSQPPQAPREAVSLEDDSDDEFGGGDLDADVLAQAEISATQAYRASQPPNVPTPSPRKSSPRKPRSPQKWSSPAKPSQSLEGGDTVNNLHRFKVKQIVDGVYTNAKGRRCPEKLLMAENERTRKTVAITLRDSWTTTAVSPGDVAHISDLPHHKDEPSSSRDPPGQHTMSDDNASALLIVHPDHLLSATTVADSFDCIRKAVLQDRIKATGETSKPMVYGKILHEVFQQALSANQWDTAFLADVVTRTVQSHVEGLWELGMRDTVLATEEVTAKMGELAAWARIFVAKRPSEVSIVDDKQGEKVWMSVSKLIAVEEHVWSPRYGLKGNIDATVQSTVVDHPDEPAKKVVAPFEVKTGRTTQSPAHRAQTALYTLLLSDRYDVAVKAGILYYLESSTMSRIAPSALEIRQMVQQRNRLAAYIHRAKHPRPVEEQSDVPVMRSQEIEDSGLPAMLNDPFKCGRCYAQQSCFTYHAMVENGTSDSAGMIDDGKKNHSLVWSEAVGHLALSVKDRSTANALKTWFAKWDKLLTFEESEMSRYRKELWTMTSTEREAIGRCFGGLVLSQDLSSTASAVTQTVVDGIEGSGGRINRYAYVLKRALPTPGTSFAEGTQLTLGEPVVVSSERGQWALANGYVIAATKNDITVAVDRRLGNARQRLGGFDETGNHALQGIMTVGEEFSGAFTSSSASEVLYRLDKDEFSNGLALVRNNLVTLMSSHPIHTIVRQQIVLNGQPTFTTPSQLPTLPPSQLGDMNEDQRAAVSKVLSAQDYALILGMPGTGKTTTIAHIIRALLADNKTILLTSFTHTAVDNILLKLRHIAPPNSILRLGVPAKINQEVQNFCLLAATPRKSIEEIEQAYMGCRIVATTCMGTNHALFHRRAFDVCIVDEASQITLPTALGPLLLARKFVLVGDHYQLPPLVQNRAALEGGLDVSLFRQLSEEHPEAVATLGKQYRMCEDIMSLSNTLIYDGQLRCGNEEVARRTLVVGDMAGLQDLHRDAPTVCGSHCWLADVLAPSRKVVYANTDPIGVPASESLTSGKNITNAVEATLSVHLVLGLLRLGVPGRNIGVITLYRSQVALIRHVFKTAGIGPEVEIDSADRFQGRDKECVILSMVRSNEQGVVGELLRDWRRVNVAFTRAKSKLVVLGSRRTLVNNELLARFLGLVDERGWVVNLPRTAGEGHGFGFGSQATGTAPVPESTPSPTKRSGTRRQVSGSPCKIVPGGTSTRILQPSVSAGNRSPAKGGDTTRRGLRVPGKVVTGHSTIMRKGKAGALKEQLAMEIFEDLTADDF